MKRLKYGVSLSQRNRRKRISPYFHKDIAVLGPVKIYAQNCLQAPAE